MAKKVALLQGNEACAQGALYAGCNFFGGYPITPSTEIAEVLSAELPKIGGKFIQMEDEIAAMASVIGASLTGAKALTATSGPGVSLKQELIGYACIAEVPCVHQRHAWWSFDRHADRPRPVRRHAGQVGHSR